MKETEMMNTATSTPATACGCTDACCHAIGVDGVRITGGVRRAALTQTRGLNLQPANHT